MFGPMTQQTERARIENEKREAVVKAAQMANAEPSKPVNIVSNLRKALSNLRPQSERQQPVTGQQATEPC